MKNSQLIQSGTGTSLPTGGEYTSNQHFMVKGKSPDEGIRKLNVNSSTKSKFTKVHITESISQFKDVNYTQS
jgi:hypothetical protein